MKVFTLKTQKVTNLVTIAKLGASTETIDKFAVKLPQYQNSHNSTAIHQNQDHAIVSISSLNPNLINVQMLTPSLPSQRPFLIEFIRAAQPRAKFHVFLCHLCVVPIELLPCRPDFLVGGFLPGIMVDDRLTAQVLEEQWALFHARVHLTIEEYAVVDVALRGGAQHLVLGHDAFVHLVDGLEVFLGCVLVAEDLVGHGGFVVTVGYETLNKQEVGTIGG